VTAMLFVMKNPCQYDESLTLTLKMFINENDGRPAVEDCRSTLDVHESVHREIIMKAINKMQIYRLIYYP
jgi:hypothetical protein